MEITTIEKDIQVMYIQASSFPEGVLAAHQKLHSLFPYSTERKYFGISWMDKGKINYKAAAEELKKGEANQLNCETFLVRKGSYAFITVKDFMKDVSSIEKAFQKLLSHPDLDPNGYCLEWYLNDSDVNCMVLLKS